MPSWGEHRQHWLSPHGIHRSRYDAGVVAVRQVHAARRRPHFAHGQACQCNMVVWYSWSRGVCAISLIDCVCSLAGLDRWQWQTNRRHTRLQVALPASLTAPRASASLRPMTRFIFYACFHAMNNHTVFLHPMTRFIRTSSLGTPHAAAAMVDDRTCMIVVR